MELRALFRSLLSLEEWVKVRELPLRITVQAVQKIIFTSLKEFGKTSCKYNKLP